MGDDAFGSALVLATDAGSRGASLPLLVSLHARGGDAASQIVRARSMFGAACDVAAPQAARPCNPFQSNQRGGYQGFSWYLGDDASRPEAASFGDALSAVEMFVRDLSRPFVLAGEGQGAVLAVTLAMFAPRNLVGVHASGLAVADLDGWEPPWSPLPQVEFVLAGLSASRRAQASKMLAERDARVVSGDAFKTPQRAAWLESRAAVTTGEPHGAATPDEPHAKARRSVSRE